MLVLPPLELPLDVLDPPAVPLPAEPVLAGPMLPELPVEDDVSPFFPPQVSDSWSILATLNTFSALPEEAVEELPAPLSHVPFTVTSCPT